MGRDNQLSASGLSPFLPTNATCATKRQCPEVDMKLRKAKCVHFYLYESKKNFFKYPQMNQGAIFFSSHCK